MPVTDNKDTQYVLKMLEVKMENMFAIILSPILIQLQNTVDDASERMLISQHNITGLHNVL